MRISVIVSTVGRVDPLRTLFESLAAQTHRDFQVLVVDQNPPGTLEPLVAEYAGRFALHHLRSPRGASRGRNVGLEHAAGEVIAFPDDDCWYHPNLLAEIDLRLRDHPDWDGVTVRSLGPSGAPNALRWPARPGFVTRYGVWHQAIEYTMFFRRRVTARVGPFNVELGVGAGTPWGAGEGTDYLLRSLEAGYLIRYCPDLGVFHPDPAPRSDHRTRPKVTAYARGGGRVLRDHKFPWWYCAFHVSRPLAAAIVCRLTGRAAAAATYFARARALAEGLWRPRWQEEQAG
jgi:glycosyltransferase involved in cell wall biosynthesis